jgi:aryl-alcohol dehydrogenase-like predicted oxidoreductase
MTTLDRYITLGRSGLRVSPLCLGSATFDGDYVGIDEALSYKILDRYIETGGNFIDSADFYSEGKSESLIGRYTKKRSNRDKLVIGTKYTMRMDPENINSAGNSRINLLTALENSLKRLNTDYVDVYWTHMWDTVTPVEEVVSTLSDLVRSGKIRYYGFSNCPAWYITRAYCIAERYGYERPIALQMQYSLIERNIEREFIPLARELDIAICPWSPLSDGFLSGKYKREGNTIAGQGRLGIFKEHYHDFLKPFTEKDWAILEYIKDLAQQMNITPAQVALRWVLTQPAVACINIGATSVAHLQTNIDVFDFGLSPEVREKLCLLGAPEAVYPYKLFEGKYLSMLNGDVDVKRWSAQTTLHAD